MSKNELPARTTEFGSPGPVWADQSNVAHDPVGSDGDEESGLDLQRLIAGVLRFKWLVVLATLLGAVGGGVAWSRTDLEYVAEGSLWLQRTVDGGQGPITGARLMTASSWIELLRSFAVLNAVAIEQRLYLSVPDTSVKAAFSSFGIDQTVLPGDYEIRYSAQSARVTLMSEGRILGSAAPGEKLGAIVGFDWTPPVEQLPPETSIAFSVVAPEVAAGQIDENLTTRMDLTATFISVDLRGTDPDRIAATLNAVLDKHVDLAAVMKGAALEERTSVLEGQLASIEAELRDAERELEAFKIITIALPSDDAVPIQGGIGLAQGPAFQAYNALGLEIESMRSGRRAMERVLADLPDSTLRVEALEAIPEVQASSQLVAAMTELNTARVQLRALRQQYTDQYRGVQDLMRIAQVLETETVPDLLRSVVQRVSADEERLQARIDDATLELGDIPPRTIAEAGLERSVALAERLYGELRGRYQEAALASASSVPDVQVLDRAPRPGSPEVDNRIRAALMVLLGGLGGGVGLALLLDRFDPRVQYAGEVADALGLEILGVIPVIDRDGRGNKKENRQAVEAFRHLRLNLEFAYGTGKPLAFTLTSPSPSEGKSTLVANLASSFADVGHSILVIDGDTRRGDVHTLLDVPRKPGLTDFLRGDADLAETVQATKISGVHVIASGSRFESSPELVASRRLGDIRAELWGLYDVIIVDSPPLGAGADAVILGTLTGQLGLVLRTGQTDMKYAQAKLRGVERFPLRMLGVILNGCRPGPAQGYYAYSDYVDGYDALNEAEHQLGHATQRPRIRLGPAKGERHS